MASAMRNFVVGRVRRMILMRAIICGTLAVLIIGVSTAAGLDYLHMFQFAYPVYNLGQDELVKSSQLRPGTVVQFKVLIYSEVDSSTAKKGDSLLAIKIQDAYVLVSLPYDRVGYITSQSEYPRLFMVTEMPRATQEAIAPSQRDEIAKVILNYIPNADRNVSREWITGLIALAFFVLMLVFLVLYLVPGSSRCYHRISTYEPQNVTIGAFDSEMSGAERIARNTFLTPHWLGKFTLWTAQIQPLRNLVWAYFRRARLFLCFTDGRVIQIPMKSEELAAMAISECQYRGADPAIGYSMMREALFRIGDMVGLRDESPS